MKQTILLVEDEAIISLSESSELKKLGYNVISVSSGEDAVDAVCTKNETVDLILMDIDLGSGIDGTETAQIILKKRTLPILFLSSHTEKSVVEKVEGITTYGYIVKNAGTTVLDASIKMAFKLFNANQILQIKMDEINDLYNNAPCGYHSAGEDGTILQINDTELSWLGYRREEIVGVKKITDLIPPDGLKAFQDEFPTSIQNGPVNDFELSLQKKNGSILPARISSNVVYDCRGRYLMSRSIVIDTTERTKSEIALKRSQHELEVYRHELEMQNEQLKQIRDTAEITAAKYSLLYEKSPVGYFAFARDGSILELNESGAAMLGKHLTGLIGSNFKFFIANSDRPAFASFLQKVFTDIHEQSCDIALDRSSADSMLLSLKMIHLSNDGKCHMAAFDITDLRRAQDTIKLLEI